ncbi:MAG: sporulation integral membrane protein YtvI [Oscillospiraceae bacterium]|nr:sporulation integral membrane protein YtvI [Oscillospiraceae bacterium]
MPQSPFRKLFLIIGIAALVFFGVRYLMPVLLPFALAVLLALIAEPLVGFFQRKAKLPRGLATGIGMTMTLVLFILVIMVLVSLLVRELGMLAGVVPDLAGTAMQGMDSLQLWLSGIADRTPENLQPLVRQGVDGLFSNGTAIIDQISTKLLGLASGILSKLPDSVLGIGTWLLAGYMISAKLPNIRSWIRAHLPARWRENYFPALQKLKRSVLGWLLAQGKLISITFLILTIGFFILQISYAPLWAALISLVDALPILGTGMVLVPWSLVCFLQGDSIRAVGLLGIYAVAALIRQILEPRFVGKHLGLDPLVTLFAMYAGYRLFGLGGMILSPLLAVTVTQLFHTPARGK